MVAASLGLAAAGCGSGGESQGPEEGRPASQGPSDPVRWAGTFCGGLNEVITSAAGVAQLPAEPAARKDALLAFTDSARQSMDATAGKLERLGAPGVPDGPQTQQVVLGFFSRASDATAAQRERLAALDPRAADFDQQLATVVSSSTVGQLTGQVTQVTAKPELAPAFRNAPECQQLGAPR
ncbi:MAG: hypothetical protein ACRDRZ_15590 [Pseudonocardiaceae bacterium]